jgi:cation diffusion facilitator CzcD-associated flavoprotein CzcO
MSSQSNVAIVGAGPYGLSVAAHLRSMGVDFRIFGKPMYTWREQMPLGMSLKSDGFASSLSDAEGVHTIGAYCRQQGIVYDDTRVPVHIETFIAYGQSFQKHLVPELEESLVTHIEKTADGFRLHLEDGGIAEAKRVVLAIGINHFHYVPEVLSHLPAEYLSHSSSHKDPAGLKGRSVIVIGSGASALDLATLMHESGVDVTVLSRRSALKFHAPPAQSPSLWKQLRWPQTGIGPGWKAKFFTDAPAAFHLLPEDVRLRIVKRYLGPSGGWWLKDRFVDKVPHKLGLTPQNAEIKDGKVQIAFQDQSNAKVVYTADHIIAATGYRVDVRRLHFLSQELQNQISQVQNTPVLSSAFQSSVPGLYFVGVATANSFGPVMRFAFGADYTAKRISRHLAKLRIPESTRAVIAATVS